MYYDFTVKIPDVPGKIVLKKKGDAVYGYTGAVKPPVRMTGNRESGHKETGMCAAEQPSRRRCSSGWAAS